MSSAKPCLHCQVLHLGGNSDHSRCSGRGRRLFAACQHCWRTKRSSVHNKWTGPVPGVEAACSMRLLCFHDTLRDSRCPYHDALIQEGQHLGQAGSAQRMYTSRFPKGRTWCHDLTNKGAGIGRARTESRGVAAGRGRGAQSDYDRKMGTWTHQLAGSAWCIRKGMGWPHLPYPAAAITIASYPDNKLQ